MQQEPLTTFMTYKHATPVCSSQDATETAFMMQPMNIQDLRDTLQLPCIRVIATQYWVQLVSSKKAMLQPETSTSNFDSSFADAMM